ncbi:MAG: M4 family metallopeptidase [Candidatus Limnocylindrales bacterium]
MVLCVLATTSVAAAGPPAAAQAGFRVLEGNQAAAFRLPADVRLVRTWRDERRGLTYERYQQYVQPFSALVEGSQLTVVRRGANAELVVGAHYPAVGIRNRLLVDGKAAIGRAVADRTLLHEGARPPAAGLQHRTQLRLDPLTGRLFQRVESGAPGIYVIHEIDAETGAVLDAWDEIDHATPGMGTGVRGDRKSLRDEEPGSSDDLTTLVSGVWRMQTADGRMSTYDAQRDDYYGPGLAVLADNLKAGWANDNDWAAAYERHAVDAEYYGRLTDNYYLDPANVGGFDFLSTPCVNGVGVATGPPLGQIRAVVHYDEWPFGGYANAFWDGFSKYFVFGDGDGATLGGLSGSQDIVSHEMTHAVTQCRAQLDYHHQSGALNEAISDIMATAMEWQLNESTSSNCRRQAGQTSCPDWWVGEDAILGGPDFGFRNLADPESAGQPGHWQDMYLGSGDNFGVHINSTIPSHAFYLMANGGRNARCSGPTDSQADCDVLVPAIPLADATEILFAAWGTLPTDANFCQAHDTTRAMAKQLFQGSDSHRAAAELAWAAVGRGQADCHPSVAANEFALELNQRSIAIEAGGSGQLTATLSRGSSVTGQVDYAVGDEFAATASFSPTASLAPGPGDVTTLSIDVPEGMADGVYPLVVSASAGSRTRYASAVLVVDGNAPDAAVTAVHLATSGTISTSGLVPLQVTWSAADATSGIASSHLQGSANGTDWINLAAGGKGGTSTVSVDGATEWLRVTATDGVGNTATSSTSGPWAIGRFQEGSAIYTGAWSVLPATQNWGSVRYSTVAGAKARFSFNGTEVAWISTRGSNRGKAKVYRDGVLVAKVDLVGSTSPRRIAFTATGLAAGPHSLKVIVSGTSGRPRIDVEGFVVLGQPSP